MDSKIKKLVELYEQASKHSNYQILPPELAQYIPEGNLHVKSRYEKERMDYIQKKLELGGAVFCDIGCNCGYFSFACMKAGAGAGDLYEGNPAHAEFVKTAAEVLGLSEVLTVHNEYFTFEENTGRRYDVGLLLNVLHHVGDDYGKVQNMADAKEHILEELARMASYTGKLVFQLGFNWMGDRNRCLFETGTKEEMINWLKEGIKGYWDIEFTGIAVRRDGRVVYEDRNADNSRRMDELGEFLNRPIFILRRSGDAAVWQRGKMDE